MDLSLLVDVQHQPNHASYVTIIVLNRGTIAMQHFELRHRRFSPASTTRGMLPFLTTERSSTANSSCRAHSPKPDLAEQRYQQRNVSRLESVVSISGHQRRRNLD
jgi:hypothetical protein